MSLCGLKSILMSVSILTRLPNVQTARTLCKNDSNYGYSLARVWQPPSSANRPGRKTLFRNYQQCLQRQRLGHLKGKEFRITVDWELSFPLKTRIIFLLMWKYMYVFLYIE